MAHDKLRIGIIGAGNNTRTRHIPGLRAMPDVEIVAVCNRRAESSQSVAQEFGIPQIVQRWQDVIAQEDIDAVVIGTWPYLHCPITLAALEHGKHVLTEARMSMTAAEAHRMLAASRESPKLVAQIVPSPYGLYGHEIMRELIDLGYLGDLREVYGYSLTDALADPVAPLTWRQDAALSGYNMLTLGILHETLLRWLPPPVRVMAQVHAFVPSRVDPQSGVRREVGTPDSVQVMAVLEGRARAIYHVSGVMPFNQGMGLYLYGTKGVLHYDFVNDRISGANRVSAARGEHATLQPIEIPAERARPWRVEADFVDAIRSGTPVQLTNFETGVRYMEFTEAVARSAEAEEPIRLPLEEFLD